MHIPLDRVTIRGSRSGGPGGQNVNKVATRVEVRFRLADADWIPGEARERLAELRRGALNRRGELIVVSSRHRTREQNLQDCLAKLARWIEEASRRPRKRIRTAPTRASRRRSLDEKRRRGEVKKMRRAPGFEE
jgi:ribosome-associated protein